MNVMRNLLITCRQIKNLETLLKALPLEEAVIRASGKEILADELACHIDEHRVKLDELLRTLYNLLKQLQAETVSRDQTEEFWRKEILSMILRMCGMLEPWMKTHYLDGADYYGAELSLYEMFIRDYPDFDTA